MIDVDPDTVGPDFDYRECRRDAPDLDAALVCTAKSQIFKQKFYADGTLRSEDPDRSNRRWDNYLDQTEVTFVCRNKDATVISQPSIFVQQNNITGHYVLTTRSGEIRYVPNPGDICKIIR